MGGDGRRSRGRRRQVADAPVSISISGQAQLMLAVETIRVGRIEIFPIKSLDGVSLQESAVTAGGILESDRVYAMVDEEGAFVNGKRTPRVHDLRCEFPPP